MTKVSIIIPVYNVEQYLAKCLDNAYRLVLDGESYRSPRPYPEGLKNTLEKGGKTSQ